jgi:hypothetical protein
MSEIAKKCDLCCDYWYDSYMSLFIGFCSIKTCLVSTHQSLYIGNWAGRVGSGKFDQKNIESRVGFGSIWSGSIWVLGQILLGFFGFQIISRRIRSDFGFLVAQVLSGFRPFRSGLVRFHVIWYRVSDFGLFRAESGSFLWCFILGRSNFGSVWILGRQTLFFFRNWF